MNPTRKKGNFGFFIPRLQGRITSEENGIVENLKKGKLQNSEVRVCLNFYRLKTNIL